MKTCVYCDEIKETRVWKETGENVCYDCRIDLLDTEFESKKTKPMGVFSDLEEVVNDFDKAMSQVIVPPVLR